MPPRGGIPPAPRPRPAPSVGPPIIRASAPPASSYQQQSHAAAYAAAPHQYGPAAAPPVISSGRPGTDIQSSGAGYGSAQANAYKQTAGYRQAVQQVFRSQQTQQKAAIISGLMHHPDPWSLPETHAVRNAWDHLPTPEMSKIASTIPHDIGTFISGGHTGPTTGGVLQGAGRLLSSFRVPGSSPTSQQLAQSAETHALGGKPLLDLNVKNTLNAAAGGLAGAIQAIPTRKASGPVEQIQQQTSGLGPGTLGKRALQDVVTMGAQALPTTAQIAGNVAQGKFGKAINTVIQPYEQLAQHPLQFTAEHPGLAIAMGTGLAHGLSRVAAAPIRALAPEGSAAARIVSTDRPGIALTGNLTHERAPYSRSPTIKSQQISAEHTVFERNPQTGEMQAKQTAAGNFVHNRLMRQEVGQMVGPQERIRVVNRNKIVHAREAAVRPTLPARAVAAAGNALKYNPKAPVIAGARVFSRIVDGTIRRPGTFKADLQKHLDEVLANRPDLHSSGAVRKWEKYVRVLRSEIKKNYTVKQLAPVFKAADRFQKDYGHTETLAAAFGHYRDMSSEALQRRTLMHYAHQHLGAYVHPDLGLAVDEPLLTKAAREHAAQVAAVDARSNMHPVAAGDLLPLEGPRAAEIQRLATTTAPRRLSNEEILKHVNGPEGMGGRLPAYTSDVVQHDLGRATRQSRYVSGERRPMPITGAANTLQAFTHGLSEPGHEALTNQHAQLQGIVDAHKAQNHYLEQLSMQMPGGGYAGTYAEAKAAGDHLGLRPINIAQPFHPQESLNKAIEGMNPLQVETHAMRHSLDLEARTHDTGPGGRWALIDPQALKIMGEYRGQITPNVTMRAMRGIRNQFRTVALATSPRHIPGVAFENLIRDISYGVGFRSWLTGRRVLGRMDQIDPEMASRVRTQETGGQLAGMTQAGKTYTVSQDFAGTSVEPVLKAWEAAAKAPGVRQVRTLWHVWTKLAIDGTKHILEEQHQIAALGKHVLREHGYTEAAKTQGFVGLFKRALTLHGQMLDDAARGLFDPKKAKQTRAVINQMFGRWTDLTPAAQTGMMFAPFGLWWVNSARFLARMPVDQPIKSSMLAAATAGTEPQRQQQGLDQFMAGALPAYEQGGIPAGGNIVAQNYYSPFGLLNDPRATAGSLLLPYVSPLITAGLSSPVNWLGKPLSAPGMNTSKFNERQPSEGQAAQYILNSALSMFVPLYSKAQQIASGGSGQFDVSANRNQVLPSFTNPKGPGSLAGGLKKALLPIRKYKIPANRGGSSGSGWFLGPGSGSGNNGGWGTPASGGGGGSNGGWGPATQGLVAAGGPLASLQGLGGLIPVAGQQKQASGGGRLVAAVKGPGAAAAAAFGQVGQHVGQPRIPAQLVPRTGGITPVQARRLSPEAFYQAWKSGKLQDQGAAPKLSQLQLQQQGNQKMLAHLIDPKVPFGFLQRGPAWAQKVRTPNGVGKAMQSVIGVANAITAHHYNYEWGGGHGQIGVPGSGSGHGSGAGVGFDCSGAVSAILHAAGVLNTPLVSGQMMTIGQPGPGTKPNDITIYASPTHVVSQIGGRFFGTSGAHNPGGGADWFNASPADYAGYAVRHVSLPAGRTPQQVTAAIPQAAKWMVANLPQPVQKALAQRVAQQGQQLPAAGGQKLGGKPLPQNVTPTVFAAAVLNGMGIKPSANNLQSMTAWMQQEGGHWANQAKFNPLNTKRDEPGSSTPSGFASPGIRAYASWNQGVKATIDTLNNGLYPQIVQALKGNATPAQLSAAVASSPWGTGGFSTAGARVSPAQAAALAKIGPLSSAASSASAPGAALLPSSGAASGGPAVSGGSGLSGGTAVSGGAAETATSGLAANMLQGATAATGSKLSSQDQQLLQQLQAQQSSNLLSSFLKQGNPWDIGPKTSGFGGGGVNLGLLNTASSGSKLPALPALPSSRRKIKTF